MPKKNVRSDVLRAHQAIAGKIETRGRVSMKKKEAFATYYTPGVGEISAHLAKHPEDARTLSIKGNSVAVISDGTAVLGLGDLGPYGALPVMEGKALIFKELAGIDAWPIVLDTKDPDEIISIVKAIAPGFGGINLEDIKAPQCFRIEEELIRALDIPVMHDDQHGTAIVTLAALINASKVVRKQLKKLRVVIAGTGAAGIAVAKLMLIAGITDIVMVDRGGIVSLARKDLTDVKKAIAKMTNPRKLKGTLESALLGADVFVGLSGPNLLTAKHVETMAKDAIVFALSNPTPEIMPEEAKKGGARVIATGRSDFPNQVNNALVFPGVFRGALDRKVRMITDESKLRAAKALASLVSSPSETSIVPGILDPKVVPTVARAIR